MFKAFVYEHYHKHETWTWTWKWSGTWTWIWTWTRSCIKYATVTCSCSYVHGKLNMSMNMSMNFYQTWEPVHSHVLRTFSRSCFCSCTCRCTWRCRCSITFYFSCIGGESILAICCLPQSENNVVKYCITANSSVKYEIYSSAQGWPDDPLRVLCWPSISVSCDWCWMRTELPPAQV
jgi:hypothetical protein